MKQRLRSDCTTTTMARWKQSGSACGPSTLHSNIWTQFQYHKKMMNYLRTTSFDNITTITRVSSSIFTTQVRTSDRRYVLFLMRGYAKIQSDRTATPDEFVAWWRNVRTHALASFSSISSLGYIHINLNSNRSIRGTNHLSLCICLCTVQVCLDIP